MPVLSQFPSVTLEGIIMHPDVLMNTVFKEGKSMTAQDISAAYVECRRLWEGYKKVLVGQGNITRKQAETRWATPMLSYLGYELKPYVPSPALPTGGASTAWPSHEDENQRVPVHLHMLHSQSSERALKDGLDDRSQGASPHTVLQQHLNATEATYGLVFNGVELRLLRDAVRMSRASYVAFNLEVLFEQDLYADFTLLCQLLHVHTLPNQRQPEQEAPIERYYQKSLESSSAIREKLANALVSSGKKEKKGEGKPFGEGAIATLINGMLQANPDFVHRLKTHSEDRLLAHQNPETEAEAKGRVLFHEALNLVYRFLFLSVVEERKLTHWVPETKEKMTDQEKAEQQEKARKRELYMKYYSLKRLRTLVIEGRHVVDTEGTNLWADMLDCTFNLFVDAKRLDDTGLGDNLGIEPLKTGIWAAHKLDTLSHATIKNQDFMDFLAPLSQFRDERKVMVPINYGALDVEELGSIYEGLLDLKGVLVEKPMTPGQYEFRFKEGADRANTGAHYTPEDLVTPLLVHSLDHLMADALKKPTKQEKLEALLSLRIIDPACGSGHILLSAARRLATAVAKVQHDTEQPTDALLRPALRQVISRCIYGVDINPMALELCKMAFWLEAHEPGKPLSFLDHHLQCGDSLVGLCTATQLWLPVLPEAFTAMPNDDKELVKQLAKQNKDAITNYAQYNLFADDEKITKTMADQLTAFNLVVEETPEDVINKTKSYNQMMDNPAFQELTEHANAMLAPYFIKKNKENAAANYTTYQLMSGLNIRQRSEVQMVAAERKFLHWFIAFPDVMQSAKGGFDLVVGNPPFLGSQRISGTFGPDYLNYLKAYYTDAGAIDLVAYFFRRASTATKQNGFYSFISTNTIAQGSTREGGLDILVKKGDAINHAVRSMRWPGLAAVEVALVTLYRGQWQGPLVLGGKKVERITPYLDTAKTVGNPIPLKENEGKSFQGSVVLGKGFVMEPEEAAQIIAQDAKYAKVLKPYLNGEDLNSRPDQSPSRWVINFYDWPLRRYTAAEWQALEGTAKENILKRMGEGKFIPLAPPDYTDDVAADYPICLEIVERLVKPEREKQNDAGGKEKWWLYMRSRPEMHKAISGMERVIVSARVCKHLKFVFTDKLKVFHEKCVVFAEQRFNKYAAVNSSIYLEWVWKYSSTMKRDLNYSPSDSFLTYPFPTPSPDLETIGEQYHELRQSIMLEYQIGLTSLYNLFHEKEILDLMCLKTIAPKLVSISRGKSSVGWVDRSSAEDKQLAKSLAAAIVQLRTLHVHMDTAVRDAYGWQDLDLGHGFHEVDYLPENDKIRYTISETARAVVLERLLEENLRRGEAKNIDMTA